MSADKASPQRLDYETPEQYFLAGGGGFEDTPNASTFSFTGMCEMALAYAEYRVAAAESVKERETRERLGLAINEAIAAVKEKRGDGKFGKDENGWWDKADEIEQAVAEAIRREGSAQI